LITLTRGCGLVAIALLIAGCATKPACVPGPYLDARAVPPLVIPEGLAAPDRQMALRVPDSRSAPGTPVDRCVIEPPMFFANAGDPNPEGLPIRPSTMAGAPAASVAASSRVTREVTAFIEQWAEAWGRRDFDAWVQFYEPDFTPEGYENNAAWRADQQRLFGVQASTRIEAGSVNVNVLPEGKVRARFTQHFGVGEQERSVIKELVLAPGDEGSDWLIADDYVVEIL
jgi:hypothetical protein